MSLPPPVQLPSSPGPVTFSVVVPVKPPAHGKSRLTGARDEVRVDLAHAFALDTVAAALATPGVVGVLVVTDDHRFAVRFAAMGCSVIPDGVTGDLNASLVQGAADAARRWPDSVPVALCADLPALRPHELALALLRSEPGAPSFVPDSAGTGTTTYVGAPDRFSPRFGPDSRAAHEAAGAVALEGPWPSLRQDVDDLDDLRLAWDLGCGPATRDVVARHQLL